MFNIFLKIVRRHHETLLRSEIIDKPESDLTKKKSHRPISFEVNPALNPNMSIHSQGAHF